MTDESEPTPDDRLAAIASGASLDNRDVVGRSIGPGVTRA